MALTHSQEKNLTAQHYNHGRYNRMRWFLKLLIQHIGFNLLAKVDHAEGLENIPQSGPAILMMNHISFADSLIVLQLTPRYIVPLAKMEVYNYPVIGIFPKLWHVIPVRREDVDRQAIRSALEVLAAGEIILLAPEGTRGKGLQQGKEGVAYLASRGEAPIVPVAVTNTPGLPAFRTSKRWKGPGAVVQYGKPFHYKPEAGRRDLRKMTDEAMYVLSAMLPEELRGVYSDLSKATTDTIEW